MGSGSLPRYQVSEWRERENAKRENEKKAKGENEKNLLVSEKQRETGWPYAHA